MKQQQDIPIWKTARGTNIKHQQENHHEKPTGETNMKEKQNAQLEKNTVNQRKTPTGKPNKKNNKKTNSKA